MSNEEECDIEGYIINYVHKNDDKDSTPSICTRPKQKDGTFKAKMSYDAVINPSEGAFQCRELRFPTCNGAYKWELASKIIITRITSPTSMELPDNRSIEKQDYAEQSSCRIQQNFYVFGE